MMQIKSTSTFKDAEKGTAFLQAWNRKMQELNHSFYRQINLQTALGKTVVWGYNADRIDLETMVYFPGFRTCGFFADFDNALGAFKDKYRIFLVDTNGQPSLSDGNTPAIKSAGYGLWAAEVLDKLGIDRAYVFGASFGGLVTLKLCLSAPEKVKKAILMNPAGIRDISYSPIQLYYNLLPTLSPSRKHVEKFLNHIVFYKDKHQLTAPYHELLVEYQLYVLKNFQLKADLPYPLSKKDLSAIRTPLYLLLGDKDPLFPQKGTIIRAKKYLPNLKGIKVIEDTAHGIETSKKAMKALLDIVQSR